VSSGFLRKHLTVAVKQLKLHSRVFFFKVLEEAFQQLVGIVNAFSILSDDPNHTCLFKRFVQRIQVITESCDNTPRISSG
jgi:hypothetical protein